MKLLVKELSRRLKLDKQDFGGSSRATKALSIPARLVLPLRQHIGAPLQAMVNPGDFVLKGQMLARSNDYMSVPVHASTSGTVLSIGDEPVPHPSGLAAPAIVIEADGRDTWIDRKPVTDYTSLHPSALRNIVREAGIVGLGGAGFPAYIKMNPGLSTPIDDLVLNGVECEPLISCDNRLMRENSEEIVGGARILKYALRANRCFVAIKETHPEAIEAMRAVCGDDIEVVGVPSFYPAGDEGQLLKMLTGKEVPSTGLPADIGCAMQNVATAAAIYRAVVHGEPLISRIVTVTGRGVAKPRNLRVALGTPVSALLENRAWDEDATRGLVMGGPMMGFALHSADVPIIKTSNCIVALTKDEMEDEQPVQPCIRCGACADVCPVDLLPQQLYWFARAKDFEKAREYDLFDCMECGCCDYVCPSNIPLVHYYRFAKNAIASTDRDRLASDIARQRFEFREARLEQQKQDRELRLSRRREELEQRGSATEAKDAVAAAIARARSSRAARNGQVDKPVQHVPDESEIDA